MEQLPADLTTKILEFSSLPERLKLARCSTGLLRVIAKERTSLWVEIDFSREMSPEHAAMVSDVMLLGLLMRVDARNVTKYLNLQYCSTIRGWGLSALVFSRVLERIHLCPFHPSSLDESAVIAILRTIVPYQLWDVDLDWNRPIRRPRNAHQPFLFDLREAKRRQAIEQRVTCHCCQNPVADEARQVVPNVNGLPCCNCAQCLHSYCRMGSCPMALKDCSFCGVTSCEACDSVRQCHDCKFNLCGDCVLVGNPCRVCNNAHCLECVFSVECQDCKTTICRECSVESALLCELCETGYCGSDACHHLEICFCCNTTACSKCSYGGLNVCVGCGSGYCDDTHCGFFCQGCEGSFCSQCTGSLNCDECHGRFCNDCIGTCSLCEKFVCTMFSFYGEDSCAFLYCQHCGGAFCGDCRGTICTSCDSTYCCDCVAEVGYDLLIGDCDECYQLCCYKCREVSRCYQCNIQCCSTCRDTKQCDKCSAALCVDCGLDTCNHCGGAFCSDCQATICTSCDATYCCDCVAVGFNTLIGNCDSCSQLCCTKCGDLYRCDLCNKQCCWTCYDTNRCDKCSSTLCPGCVVDACVACQATLCDYCKNISGKDGGSSLCCSVCQPVNKENLYSVAQDNEIAEPPKKKARRIRLEMRTT